MASELSPEAPAITGGQHLTFTVGPCSYGIDILRVQEIKGQSQITAIPGSPPHVLGVMNLRGTVVPVLDLRMKFGTPASASTSLDVIIVANVGSRIVGLVVDAVSDVLDLDAHDIVPASDLGAGVDTSFIVGMAKNADRLIALLAIDRVVGTADIEKALAA